MQKKLAKFGLVVSRYASGQTDKQIDILITILRNPPAGEVKIVRDRNNSNGCSVS